MLRDLLDELDDRMGFPRGALVVGLGMLGETVEFERTITAETDHDAVSAWVLAIVLADWEEAEEILKAEGQGISGQAGRRLETALRRIRGGYLVSAVE